MEYFVESEGGDMELKLVFRCADHTDHLGQRSSPFAPSESAPAEVNEDVKTGDVRQMVRVVRRLASGGGGLDPRLCERIASVMGWDEPSIEDGF
jgi:hypothetical protein